MTSTGRDFIQGQGNDISVSKCVFLCVCVSIIINLSALFLNGSHCY